MSSRGVGEVERVARAPFGHDPATRGRRFFVNAVLDNVQILTPVKIEGSATSLASHQGRVLRVRNGAEEVHFGVLSTRDVRVLAARPCSATF